MIATVSTVATAIYNLKISTREHRQNQLVLVSLSQAFRPSTQEAGRFASLGSSFNHVTINSRMSLLSMNKLHNTHILELPVLQSYLGHIDPICPKYHHTLLIDTNCCY
jgi:hypothetical protein